MNDPGWRWHCFICGYGVQQPPPTPDEIAHPKMTGPPCVRCGKTTVEYAYTVSYPSTDVCRRDSKIEDVVDAFADAIARMAINGVEPMTRARSELLAMFNGLSTERDELSTILTERNEWIDRVLIEKNKELEAVWERIHDAKARLDGATCTRCPGPPIGKPEEASS